MVVWSLGDSLPHLDLGKTFNDETSWPCSIKDTGLKHSGCFIFSSGGSCSTDHE